MRYPGEPRYAAGVGASIVAESVFTAMVAAVAWLRGMDPWRVVRMPASLVLGPAAVDPPGFAAGDVLAGLLMHFLLGVLVGAVYGALLPRLGPSPIAGGLMTGAVLYGFEFWLLPHLFPARLAPFGLPPAGRALQAVAHVVYGVVLGVAYRRMAHE